MTRGPGAAEEDGSATIGDRPAHGATAASPADDRPSGASRRPVRETAPLPEHTT